MRLALSATALTALLAGSVTLYGQAPPARGRSSAPTAQGRKAPAKAAPAEKIGSNRYRLGAVTADLGAREVSVAGTVNADLTTLEFIANTEGGAKAYESAITAATDAATFNAALLLIGLDPSHARVPVRHFDAAPPKGDAVEIWVEFQIGPAKKRVRAEEMLFDERTKLPLANGSWVYTGSTFSAGRLMADTDGVLIGFVHSPAPLIETTGKGAVSAYGSVVFNKRLGLPPHSPVTLIVKAVGPAAAK